MGGALYLLFENTDVTFSTHRDDVTLTTRSWVRGTCSEMNESYSRSVTSGILRRSHLPKKSIATEWLNSQLTGHRDPNGSRNETLPALRVCFSQQLCSQRAKNEVKESSKQTNNKPGWEFFFQKDCRQYGVIANFTNEKTASKKTSKKKENMRNCDHLVKIMECRQETGLQEVDTQN